LGVFRVSLGRCLTSEFPIANFGLEEQACRDIPLIAFGEETPVGRPAGYILTVAAFAGFCSNFFVQILVAYVIIICVILERGD
jgi:hypothetical protein